MFIDLGKMSLVLHLDFKVYISVVYDTNKNKRDLEFFRMRVQYKTKFKSICLFNNVTIIVSAF